MSNLIILDSGDPLPNPPDWVLKEYIDVVSLGKMTQYPMVTGEKEYVDTMNKFFKTSEEEGGLGLKQQFCEKNNVIFAKGATQLWFIFLAKIKKLNDLLQDQAKKTENSTKKGIVLVPELSYGLANDVARKMGLEIVGIPLYQKNDYKMQAQDVERMIKVWKGKANILALKVENPSNPIGAVLEKKEVEKIAGVCRRYSIPVFDDLAYWGMEYQGKKTCPIGAVASKGVGVFTALSLSKAAGCAGLRTGVGFLPWKDFMSGVFSIMDTTCGIEIQAQAAAKAFFDVENFEKRKEYVEQRVPEYLFREKIVQACINGQKGINFSTAEKKRFAEIIQKTKQGPEESQQLDAMFENGMEHVRLLNPNPEAGFFSLIHISKGDEIDRNIFSQMLQSCGAPAMLSAHNLIAPCLIPNQENGVQKYQTELSTKALYRISFAWEDPCVILRGLINLNRAVQQLGKENRITNQRLNSQFDRFLD